jgi:hypothetical protein
MGAHTLFWLSGVHSNINYDKVSSHGMCQGTVPHIYLNELTKSMSR